MKTEEAKLKVQALVDNELPEEEIPAVMGAIEGSYELREEYIALLRLKRRLERRELPEPPPEWFEDAARRAGRRAFSLLGTVFFVGSYVLLLGYAFVTLFRGGDVELWIKLAVSGVALGFLLLLLVAGLDRMRESRTDRYRRVVR